jgi:hypothetical protein
MPVAVQMEFDGMTHDQYNEVLDKMGLEPGGNGPPGALFHWCSASDDGLYITDVWESREVFDKFAQEQIGPYSAEVGYDGQPKMTFYDVTSYLKGH